MFLFLFAILKKKYTYNDMKIIDPYIQEKYSEYDDRVIEFLSRVFNDVKDNNETINNYFYCMFDLLANQLKLYYFALDTLDNEKKLASEDSYKRVAKSPSIQVLNKSHEQIINILQKFSLSPFDKAKLSRLKNGDGDQDASELLESLTK